MMVKRLTHCAADRLFTWESRPATSDADGDGFFTVVGGYDVLVRERKTGRPVTGGMVVASDEHELARNVKLMLQQFVPRWLAQSAVERRRNMQIAAQTARLCGWALKYPARSKHSGGTQFK